jgi:hypothetical protein
VSRGGAESPTRGTELGTASGAPMAADDELVVGEAFDTLPRS